MTSREQLDDWDRRAGQAQGRATQSFARFLKIAEDSDTNQARRVARFIAATWNGESFPLDLFELRAVDGGIADDMLACIDALRWAKADLWTLVPGGEQRVTRVVAAWGFTPLTKG
jgi:hypothetical protein